MKKTLLTILCALFCLFGMAQSEKTYTEQYVVSVNDEPADSKTAEVTIVDNGNGTINFMLKDFVVSMGGQDMQVGDISLENVPFVEDNNGLKIFEQEGTYTIPAENLPVEYQAFAIFFKDIPYTLAGKMNDEKLYAVLNINMSSMGQNIVAIVGTDDFVVGTIYTEPLVVTIDGESTEPQDADVIVCGNGDGTINFELKNFFLGSIPVGTIYVENIATENGQDGLTHFAFNGNIFIQDGDLGGVPAWIGPDLNNLITDDEGNAIGIPIVLNGKLNEEKLYATIDINLSETDLGQVVYVQLGTDDFSAGKVYTEPLVITIDGESTEPQDADVIVYGNADGTINFELKNFFLGGIPVGTIYVENIATEVGQDGLAHFAFNGNIFIQNGDLEGVPAWIGPDLNNLITDDEGNAIGIPIVLNGKLNEDKLYATIDINLSETDLGQVVYVQLGTDDFVTFKKGDVNQDNTVDIADAVSVLNAMAGQEVAGDPDVNGDQIVDIADLVTVLNIMAGQ